MTDTQRCEPPEHLRGVDGWHWVEAPSIKTQFVRRWWRARGEWCWADMDERTLRSFRYLAPVAPPATVAALVEALEVFANATILPTGAVVGLERNWFDAARAALALYRGEVA